MKGQEAAKAVPPKSAAKPAKPEPAAGGKVAVSRPAAVPAKGGSAAVKPAPKQQAGKGGLAAAAAAAGVQAAAGRAGAARPGGGEAVQGGRQGQVARDGGQDVQQPAARPVFPEGLLPSALLQRLPRIKGIPAKVGGWVQLMQSGITMHEDTLTLQGSQHGFLYEHATECCCGEVDGAAQLATSCCCDPPTARRLCGWWPACRPDSELATATSASPAPKRQACVGAGPQGWHPCQGRCEPACKQWCSE